MNFRIILLAAVIGSTSFITSCCRKTQPAAITETTSDVKITAADNGKTFQVKVNGNFEATFNECVGCAEVWKVTAIDNAKVETLPNTYSNRSCTDCTGGTQNNTFHFKAKATGTSVITFSYFEQVISVTIEAK